MTIFDIEIVSDVVCPWCYIGYRQRMLARIGPERAPAIAARLKAVAGAEGILLSDDGLVGGTALCHVLLLLAGKISPEQQNKVAEDLFRAYFEEARDIFNVPNLVEVGVAAGMERGALEKGLADENALEEVKKEEQDIKTRLGRGVPRFFLGSTMIEGAKDMEDFFEVFLQIKEGKEAKEE
ncbi:hypothetical protein VE03_04331 [Pseudogymnoascus sp. 23342-1-I1]|nr:hypothetical protein VE03_04331 [Pseudogymnoascus sp. 23342-1-I1]